LTELVEMNLRKQLEPQVLDEKVVLIKF
jgi:hypothetical protein